MNFSLFGACSTCNDMNDKFSWKRFLNCLFKLISLSILLQLNYFIKAKFWYLGRFTNLLCVDIRMVVMNSSGTSTKS